MIQRLLSFFVKALPLVFMALFFFYPLLTILGLSFRPQGVWAWDGISALWTGPSYRRVLGFTLAQASASTLLTLAAGLPAAFVMARYRFPGKALLRALLTVPFVLPTVVVAAAFLALLGPRGLLNEWLVATFQLAAPPLRLQNSLTLILLAHVFYNLSIVVRIVGGFWANLDPQLGEAAAMLGASPARRFREITLPLLLPALAAAALLIFLFTFNSFGVVLILGGFSYATIEVEIYRQALSLFNLPLAASLSLLQMGCTLAMTVLYSRLQARASRPLLLRSQAAAQRLPGRGRERALLVVALGLPLLFVVAPLLALLLRSLTVGDALSLEFYRTLGENERRTILAVAPLLAVRNSLLFALATTVLSVLLALTSAYLLAPPAAARPTWWRNLLDPLLLLPLGTSAVTLGFGFVVALDEPPLNLRTSPLLVPLAHALVAFPFVVRSLLPRLRSIQPALREAAAMLGASPARVLWEIDRPLLAPALLVGMVFAFAISMGEFGASALISRPEWPTIPLLIFRFLGQPGAANYGRALAMSVILMSITILGFLLVERLRPEGGEEF